MKAKKEEEKDAEPSLQEPQRTLLDVLDVPAGAEISRNDIKDTIQRESSRLVIEYVRKTMTIDQLR
eukprot:14810890-Alexandrium_andersonii.AAC.1